MPYQKDREQKKIDRTNWNDGKQKNTNAKSLNRGQFQNSQTHWYFSRIWGNDCFQSMKWFCNFAMSFSIEFWVFSVVYRNSLVRYIQKMNMEWDWGWVCQIHIHMNLAIKPTAISTFASMHQYRWRFFKTDLPIRSTLLAFIFFSNSVISFFLYWYD